MTKEQFAQLVLDSTDTLYRVSRGILRNESDCEDAVWEAIGLGFSSLHSLKQDKYAKTWLVRILIHECYRVLRQQKRRVQVQGENLDCVVYHNGTEEELLYSDRERPGFAGAEPGFATYHDLYEAIFSLDEKYKIPIILFYLEGYSIREIAEILKSTENTVKSWLARGRSQLRAILEEE